MNNQKPTAHVAVKKNRVKIYNDSNIYLEDGQEFELELFNPTNTTVLAKIQLNGSYISSSGIVLRPGERVWLDRFLDSPDKFKFDTYEVGSSKEVKEAIKNNGKIAIEFFDEQLYNQWWNNGTITINNTDPNWWKTTTGGNFYIGDDLLNSQPIFGSSTSSSTEWDGTLNCSSSSFTSSVGSDSLKSLSNASDKEETGRVEKGSKSDQKFESIKKDFNNWRTNIVEYQIFPSSKKPIYKQDIRKYCTECGSKVKKSNWKFCPSCGGRI